MIPLEKKYKPAPACSCGNCLRYCYNVPGMWTVAQAHAAIEAGYGNRMMLRLPPGRHGILTPAIKGLEGHITDIYAIGHPCTFLSAGLCDLHKTPHKPLECRVTSHDRGKQSKRCHTDIVKEWDSAAGQQMVKDWARDYLVEHEKWYAIEELGALD